MSSLLIMEEAPPVGGQGALAGLITDRDLRARVLSRGLSLSIPVRDIMSTTIICCRTDDYAFEAMLTMMRHNLHHLPVLHKGNPVGVITAADIVQYESHGSVYLVSEIFKQPEEHDAYFADLAAFVSDGLAACDYSYCDGGIMGTNPRWRQPLKAWQQMFNGWIDDPDPEALLHCSIFFDLEGIYGQLKLAESLKRLIREKAPKSRKFLAHIARNALLRNPPLGFFRKFVLEPNGEQIKTFNLKERGTSPISDLVRVHALACGSRAVNTLERLADVNETDLLPEGVSSDLIDALEFISMVRIRHQAKQIEIGIEPDNNVEPKRLSSFERRHLRNAFQIVDKSQSFLRFRYTASDGMWKIK